MSVLKELEGRGCFVQALVQDAKNGNSAWILEYYEREQQQNEMVLD